MEWVNQVLNTSQYIIVASNRLHIPLRKLRDCKKFKSCYPITARYYDNLFTGRLPFKQVAEFAVYPHISVGSITFSIPDQSADESFTVYDHPRILIFKRL